MNEIYTVGRLIENTSFKDIFPSGFVPIVSIMPIIPREEGCPRCYLVDVEKIEDWQILALARLMFQKWSDSGEVESVEVMRDYIVSKGCPLKVEYFRACRAGDPIYG